MNMNNVNLSVFISETKIKERIKMMGEEIQKKFKGEKNILALCVLRGSFIFFSDLIRSLDLDLECDFIGVSSYGNKMSSSGEIKLTLDVATSLKDKAVILVEDIVDTGLTVDFLQKFLLQKGPRSLTTVTFLHKPDAMQVSCPLDFIGFQIPNDFVVGYGLDYQGYYRHLPYLAQIQSFN